MLGARQFAKELAAAPAHYGFPSPGNECIKATMLGIADELTRDGLLLRYRVKGTDKVSLICRCEWVPLGAHLCADWHILLVAQPT
jgi:hypothetical protein